MKGSGGYRKVKKRKEEVANFTIPALTTPRTTAFMPALSPPEVSTAIFIVFAAYEGGRRVVIVDEPNLRVFDISAPRLWVMGT